MTTAVPPLDMHAGNALRAHRFLLRLALSASNAFAWIFVFAYFYATTGSISVALVRVVLLYALAQTSAVLMTPLAARGLRHGMRREMVFAVLAAAAALVFLGASLQGSFVQLPLIVFVGFALLLGLYRALYWIPYEVERRDVRTPLSRFSFEIFIALISAFVGVLLFSYGAYPMWTLFAAATVMIVSIAPLIAMPDVYEGFPWGYRETFGALIDRAHRRVAFNAALDGMQGAALLIVWPLAIFLVVDRSYEFFGLLLSITLLIMFIVREVTKRHAHHLRVLNSLPVRVAIVSSAWIGRMLIVNPMSIIVADAYLHAGDPKMSTDHNAFEQLSDAGHFIDEFTVIREIGLLIGRILLCVVFAIAAMIFPPLFAFGAAFVITGIAAGFSIIISGTTRRTI